MEWLLFGVRVVKEAKLVPEEEGEDGVRAEAEVGGSNTLVHAKNALCPSRLQQSVQHPSVHEALRAGWRRRERTGKESVRAHQGSHLCRLPFRLSHLALQSAPPPAPLQFSLPEPQSTPLPCPECLWAGCRALCSPHQRVSWPGPPQCHSPWQLPEPPSSSGEEISKGVGGRALSVSQLFNS